MDILVLNYILWYFECGGLVMFHSWRRRVPRNTPKNLFYLFSLRDVQSCNKSNCRKNEIQKSTPIYCFEVIKCILYFYYTTPKNWYTYAQHYIIHLVYFSLWLWIIYITEAKRFCDRTSVITLVSKNFGRLIKTDKSMTGSVDTTTRFVAV